MIDVSSPFYALYEELQKALETGLHFEVELDKQARKQWDGLGHEWQRRGQKLIDQVHGSPLSRPNAAMARLQPQQLKAMGLPHTSRDHYSLGDYRIRMMGELQGNKLRIFDVRTREDSKHSGRTRR